MTTEEIRNFTMEVPNCAYDLKINELDEIAEIVSQYGIILSINKELITAYNNDELKAYCESQI